MRIFHVALQSEWEAARRSGSYTTSTLGRTLAEEGFVHASREDQWRGVWQRFYADVAEPLVLLVIDTDLLSSPVVEETPPGASETFPHVYGPIDADAVVQVVPLDADGRTPEGSFSALFLHELFRHVLLATLVLLAAVAGALGGQALDDGWGRVAGALVGVMVGAAVAPAWARRTR